MATAWSHGTWGPESDAVRYIWTMGLLEDGGLDSVHDGAESG